MPEDLAGPVALVRSKIRNHSNTKGHNAHGSARMIHFRSGVIYRRSIGRGWATDTRANSCIGKRGHSDSFELTELMLLATVAIVGAATIVLHDPINVNRNAIRVIWFAEHAMTDDDMRRARSDRPVRNRQKSASRLIYPAHEISYVPELSRYRCAISHWFMH